MAEHANGAAQYLGALLGGRYVTKEQTREMVDFLFAGTKSNKSLQVIIEYKSLCLSNSINNVVQRSK